MKSMVKYFMVGLIAFSNIACESEGFNFFSLQDDLELGRQLDEYILDHPDDFPVMNENFNPEIYQYINGIKDKILLAGDVNYRDVFPWKLRIIEDEETINAFAAPGGYLYVYTGLILFLDSEDSLAGVLGHEIAHASQRHSTRQLTKIYGIQVLLSLVTGNANAGLIEQIALSLVSLKFSRNHELEADEFGVGFICPTDYDASGSAKFFEKLSDQPTPPTWLSTHPDPGDRILIIKQHKKDLGCDGSAVYIDRYARMKLLARSR